jgi:hypothetical protein
LAKKKKKVEEPVLEPKVEVLEPVEAIESKATESKEVLKAVEVKKLKLRPDSPMLLKPHNKLKVENLSGGDVFVNGSPLYVGESVVVSDEEVKINTRTYPEVQITWL